MQVGLGGLFLWSFLMANAHGAGLMLVPAVIPLCLAASPTHALTVGTSLPIALAALGVHTAAMLATIGTVSVVVYKWVGVAFPAPGLDQSRSGLDDCACCCGVILLAI